MNMTEQTQQAQSFAITGMDCADCARTLEKGVQKLAGVQECKINFTNAQMHVKGDTPRDAIISRVRELGYDVKPEKKPTEAAPPAARNGITNARFVAGEAAALFAGISWPGAETAVVIDPPRRGTDEAFLAQLFAFGPRRVVYVSCNPATQMRDLKLFLTHGYVLSRVRPFDLFPQTKHLECVMTIDRAPSA